MPILFYKNDVVVVSYTDFIQEYKKKCPEEKSILKEITKGFDFNYSILAITEIRKRSIEKNKDEDPPRIHSFNYRDSDAQSIAMELLVVFAGLYHWGKLSVIDETGNLQSIHDYILPHGHLYYKKGSNVTVMNDSFTLNFSISGIREIRGIINNFVIHLDNQLLHFCYNVTYGKKINIVQHNYNFFKERMDRGYAICDYDYAFNRERPKKSFLSKYRKNGFLIILG